jgi:hypothetical protein
MYPLTAAFSHGERPRYRWTEVPACKLLILEGDARGPTFFETGPLLARADIAARKPRLPAGIA